MTRLIDLPEETERDQRRAANPQSSIWVAANAGSGKTHVLTTRVLRLLLAGVAPESILCLTYTKAAAAEMRRRVSTALATWALMSDAELAGALARLDGGQPGREMLASARTLFARALETPGGLKIATIHAFCESVLHRFPLEAQVPFDFSVIEEDEQANLVLAARESVIAEGLRGDPDLSGPVETVFSLMSDHAIGAAIDAALAEKRKLKSIFADMEGAKRRLRALAGVGGRSVADLEAEAVSGMVCSAAHIRRALEICPPTGGSTFEDRLAKLDVAALTCDGLFRVFLTASYEVPERFPKRAFGLADPALAGLLLAEAERLCALARQLTAARLVERSEALLDVLHAIWLRFETEKRRRSLLDFDDLIARVARLFADTAQGEWVRYKLDAGITHILVDESQDTNPEQWEVVKAIAEEFFSGEGAVDRLRTVFAVGDEKQSIYSFQGADPTLFHATGQRLAAQAGHVARDFHHVPLTTSFRTLLNILNAVDAVGLRSDIADALFLRGKLVHKTARRETGGVVTLWPPIREDARPQAGQHWPLEASDAQRSAPRQIAERIAREIRTWIDNRRPLGPRGRPVAADDVLILVQSRNALFFEIIRALHREGLPTPGADRLAVTSHIAVLDLLALGDVLLDPADDLQLAALLRSPLFDVTEDELFSLCHDRPDSLWQALSASGIESARNAHERIARWRGQLDFERPFEFFAHVLYAEGGLRRFHGRLGGEVDDVLSHFLELAIAHEQGPQPSLQGFLAALRSREVWVRRELAEGGAGVRVMTVHGAKGLEAPIVILADAANKPEGRQLTRPVIVLKEGPGPLFVHASSKLDHVPSTRVLRDAEEAKQRAEYWRRLYVGMTRAEDELYVTGVLTRKGSLDGTWYEAIEAAIRDMSEIETNADGSERALVFPRLRPEPRPVTAKAGDGGAPPTPLALDPLPPYSGRDMLQPSSAGGPWAGPALLDTARDAVRDADAARREGIALHAMLHHLVGLDRALWPEVGPRAASMLLPEAPDRQAAVLAKAMALLTRPDLSHLFGPGSRGEVPIMANISHEGRARTLVGRVDRLVVSSDRVLVVDYKSDVRVPDRPEEISTGYMLQLALYAMVAAQLFPGRMVEAAILWTSPESLMNLAPASLEAARTGFTME